MVYIYIYGRHKHPGTPKATPIYVPILGVVGLSSVATIRRRRGEEGWAAAVVGNRRRQ